MVDNKITKNFDKWNTQKKIIHNSGENKFSQIRLIDTKRLIQKIEDLDKEKFEEIKKAVKEII